MSSYFSAGSYFSELNGTATGNQEPYANATAASSFLSGGQNPPTDQYGKSGFPHYPASGASQSLYQRFPGYDRLNETSSLSATGTVAGQFGAGPSQTGSSGTTGGPDDPCAAYNASASAYCAAAYGHLNTGGYQQQNAQAMGFNLGSPMGPQAIHPGFGNPLFPWMRTQFGGKTQNYSLSLSLPYNAEILLIDTGAVLKFDDPIIST